MLLRPEWDRTCADCVRYEFDDEEDSPTRGRVELTIADEPMPREGHPPCRRCPKVPAAVIAQKQKTGDRVTPADAVEPEARHRLAVEHYLECRAVNRFPDDDWVRRHAAVLWSVVKRHEDQPVSALAGSIRDLAAKLSR